jgi:hypothetical protein
MVTLNSIGKTSAKSVTEMALDEVLSGAVKGSIVKVGKIGRFVVYRFKTGKLEYEWHAVDTRSKVSQVYVTGDFDARRNILTVSGLYKVKRGQVRAHELYYFLLKNRQVNGLAGKSHSRGAIKVWRRLASMKGVFVYGWHKDEPVWIGPRTIGIGKTHSVDDKKIEETLMIVGYNG